MILAHQALKVPQDLRVQLVMKVRQAQLVPRVLKAHKARQAIQVQQVGKAP